MFNFIKQKIKKIYDSFTEKATSLFSRSKLDDDLLRELEILLISADTGVSTTRKIMTQLKDGVQGQKITTVDQLKKELEKQLLSHLQLHSEEDVTPSVLLLVGVNGSGKTTFAGKFANKLINERKKVLLVAADTFRAAAQEQLQEWGKRINAEVFLGKTNQDPASVVFDACTKFKDENFDHLVIDTAGRLQTKVNLMKELEKIRTIISRKLPEEKIHTWLTIDSMLGQNSFQQAKIFHEATSLNGLILTKMDGTGKGGIVFSITSELSLPILYVTFGEALEDLKSFDPQEYVHNLLDN